MGTVNECELEIVDATKRFVEVVADVVPTKWIAEPPRGPWTLSEIVEHVAIANRGILGVLDRLAPSPGPSDISDDEMPYLFYGGDEPPDVGKPTGTWTDMTEALAALETSARDLIEWARASGVDLRQYGRRHPAFGMLDGAQWLRFSAVHTWRHRAQALAVRKALEG
jgi:uncharacterized damage-inducible protein DinB